MRQTLIGIVIAACVLIAAGFPAEGKELSGEERAKQVERELIGSAAPRLALKTIDGQQVDLARLYGKQAVYLKFWATWCVPCMQQMPHFEQAYQVAGPGLAVIAVNVGFNDSVEEIRKVQHRFGLTMPIVMDEGALAEALHLRVTPQHVVIGLDGHIQFVGHEDNDLLKAALLTAQTTKPGTLSAAGAAAPGAGTRYRVGDALPQISARLLDGQTFQSQGDGVPRPTVLVFLSPWCESYLEKSRPSLSKSCREVRQQVDRLARGLNVRWLGIASGLWATQDDLRDYQAHYRPAIPLALDDSGVWFRSFSVMNVPTMLLVDAHGTIVRRVDGFDPDLPAQLRRIARN